MCLPAFLRGYDVCPQGVEPGLLRPVSTQPGRVGKANGQNARHIAAIDAGSNGMRIAIARVNGDGIAREVEAWREPVRLGSDAFALGQLSDETIDAAVAAFTRFAERIEANGAKYIRAVATSAAREASNGRILAQRIRKSTGIRLEIIGGLEEAQLVFAGVANSIDLAGRSALLIDMGGGSVEVTVARNGHALGCETLSLGAVRLLAQLKESGRKEADVDEMIAPFRGSVFGLIKAELKDRPIDIALGTGGNLECLGKLRGPLLGKEKLGKVKLTDLDPMIDKLLDMTPAQRIDKLDLRPDRADVIAIAAIVLRMVMTDGQVPKILTPGIGLSQGLIYQLVQRIENE